MAPRNRVLTKVMLPSLMICDGCDSPTAMTPTRLCCVTCWEGELWHTMDFCVGCISKSTYRLKDDKDHHPTHNVLQLRWVPLKYGIHALMQRANDVLAAHGEFAGDCFSCKENGRERANEDSLTGPLWYCLDCAGPRSIHNLM